MRDYQKYATVVAVFAAVLYAALIVAAFGMISLATNLDVISEPDAGPLVGPSMAAVAVLLVFVLMLTLGVATRPDRQRVAVGYSFAAGIAAFGIFIVTGAILYAAGDGQPFHVLTFSAAMLLSPFSLATGILAVVVTLAYSWLLASRVGEHGRPLWPWERRDD
ncbi:fatty acid desaturase [Cryobacterium sp. MP_M5]|uniref:DUF6121 family protein n=1 Tax=unclassified Cryobacterium TaxID=2649013 RepID=UPI0018C90CFB|nr:MULTISPECIES: DUF6121 family protein [unclassified Cryobacterium]MBG6056981.1 fatty acid desaturase [Cryobacterium sp. MP_M3]MEC5175180.1 fatty acid desaturase [Cryobacterium sp. MP_M5]